MTKRAGFVVALALAMLVGRGHAGEPSAATSPAALAELVRTARFSDGFEARMNVSVVHTDGHNGPTLKLAVIGQFTAEKERLLIRGISPVTIRNRIFAAEREADGGIRAITYDGQLPSDIEDADPFMKLFGSDLVIWDLFGPWWRWPNPVFSGTERIAGRDCVVVRSRADGSLTLVREVVSHVERETRLALKTQLFGDRHKLLRTISVEQIMRKQSGVMAPKRLFITGFDHSRTEVQVYSGDEHYLVTPDTFSSLNDRPAPGR